MAAQGPGLTAVPAARETSRNRREEREMKHWIWFTLLVCVSCSSDTNGSGMAEGDFSDPPACPGCEIELVEIGVLGDPADETSMREDAGSAPCVWARWHQESS